MDFLTDQDEASAEERLVTHTRFTITGQPEAVTDARQYASQSGIPVMSYLYDIADQPIKTLSMDGGAEQVLNNAQVSRCGAAMPSSRPAGSATTCCSGRYISR